MGMLGKLSRRRREFAIRRPAPRNMAWEAPRNTPLGINSFIRICLTYPLKGGERRANAYKSFVTRKDLNKNALTS